MQVEPSTCPICKQVFDPLRARALIVTAGRVRAFCSETCRLAAESHERPEVTSVVDELFAVAPHRRTRRWPWALVASVACAGSLGVSLRRARPPEATVPAAEAAVAIPAFTLDDALKVLRSASAEMSTGGAERPEITERDIWLHPLAGPVRRLPVRGSRRFGAPRDGLRPEACRSGHCGVDLGEDKGEWIFAAHDGVVERVVDDDSGNEGRYVRLNHRGGTLTTSYMHLDSVRPGLHAGVPVKAGDPLGTVGETGIFHSGPHLHFQIGVRARPGESELFIDPEPLLHLWGLRAPLAEKAPRQLARTARPVDPGPQGM